MIEKILKKHSDHMYIGFRAIVGLMFFGHGLQKLISGTLLSFMGLIGVLELSVGILVTIGLLTRVAASIGTIIMIGAYFKVHAGKGLVPLLNGGELALMYLAAFLVIMSQGCKKCGIDNHLLKKKR